MTEGIVKFFNASKGFGFITADNGEEIFFHKSAVKDTGFRDTLYKGDRVRCEVKESQQGKRAQHIVRI
ncbi:MAG: cold shock domain-containing protein [bacterium]